jgi:uracil-DNA glycosylase family 4
LNRIFCINKKMIKKITVPVSESALDTNNSTGVMPYTDLCLMMSDLTRCQACERLVAWRELISEVKVKRFAEQSYWGRPVPSFGDPNARLLLVGLAPAAHGGNRTGRMFTGDRSGDWLYRALHKAGFASQPQSVNLSDGLRLKDCYITAVAHCAPPDNKLLPVEVINCRPYLASELALLKNVQIVIALGKIAWEAILREPEFTPPKGQCKPKFGHGLVYEVNERFTLIGSYHPSQQNTFTGRLTEPMLDQVFERTRQLLR